MLRADSTHRNLAEALPSILPAATEEGWVARVGNDKDSAQLDHEPEDIAELEIVHQRVLGICAWIIVFFLGIWLFGFKIASLLLTFAFLKFSANERWAISITLSVVNYLFFLIVFDYALRVPLSSGLLLESFAPSFEIGRILKALTGG
jgi:small-conductance mechanosensitive channel